MTVKYKGLGIFLSVAILLVLASCSEPEVPPWTDSEMEELLGYFGEIGEAYALLDICMPMLEADAEAKYELVSAIKADRYAKLLQMDTSYELRKLFKFFRERGGSPDQNLQLRLHYDKARGEAAARITSAQVCVDTIKDYANTMINMRVQ